MPKKDEIPYVTARKKNPYTGYITTCPRKPDTSIVIGYNPVRVRKDKIT